MATEHYGSRLERISLSLAVFIVSIVLIMIALLLVTSKITLPLP